MSVYYNEIDPKAAAWLRELMRCGLVAQGEVDERSIVEVEPCDLRGFNQCHFFAGIGVWSYALRRAGWSDDRPVWTGSCPCQPFSAAGKREADRDSRHLAPTWLRLIRECRPATIFGEQVDAAIRVGWLDALFTELELDHYACGAVSFPACSVGAPHIRQRLYFVAESQCGASERHGLALDGAAQGVQGETHERERFRTDPRDGIDPRSLDHSADARRQGEGQHGSGSPLLAARSEQSVSARSLADPNGGFPGDGELQRGGQHGLLAEDCGARGLAHDQAGRRSEVDPLAGRRDEGDGAEGSERPLGGSGLDRVAQGDADHAGSQGRRLLGATGGGNGSGERAPRETGATNGFWRAADWLPCIDGKARPVEPGTFPLAHGSAERVGRLRGYGNAIVAPQAQAFIKAYLEATA